MTPPYGSPSDLVCAAALRIGAMTRDGTTWKFKRRHYSNETGRRAVVQGIAVQRGNELRAAAPSAILIGAAALSHARGIA